MNNIFTPKIKHLLYAIAIFYIPLLNAQNSSSYLLKESLAQEIQAECFQPRAGEDHIYCQLPGNISLTASPLGQGQTGSWSQIEGLPTTIERPLRPTTLVSGLQSEGGPYVYVWSILGPDCGSSDTIKLYQRPTWDFQDLQDAPCATTHNEEEDIILKTESVAFDVVDEFTISLIFMALPEGVESISVFPQITGSTQGVSSTASSSLDLFNDGNNSDVAQLGVPLEYTVTAKLINEKAPSTVLSHEQFSLALLFDEYQARGKYKYSVSISNACGSNSFERLFTNSGFSLLSPEAGPDLYLSCNESSTSLNGTGLYYPNQADPNSIHAGIWYTLSGPGADPLNESNRYSPNPSLTNLVQGVYTFRYIGQFGAECQLAYDDVKVHVNNSAPTNVSAVLNQNAVCGTGVAQMVAQKGSSTGLGTWTQLAPAVTTEQMIFGSSTDTVYLQDLKSFTNYTLQYTNSNNCGSASATVSFRTGKFKGPSVANIEKKYACINKDSFNLEADTVTFGYPSWEFVSGPIGAVPVFSTPTSNKTAISGLTEEGVYVVKFSIFTIPCNIPSEDYMTIVKGTAPLLDAGSDLLDCQATFPRTMNMAATEGSNSSTRWSFVSGPSVPNILDPSARNTAVTFSQPGTYLFDWVSSYANCSEITDRVEVRLGEGSTTAIAGPDQEMCGSDGGFTLDAHDLAIDETGVWTVFSTTGNLSVTFADRTDPNTSVVLNNSGEAVLRWTTYGTNNACHSSDDVSLKWTAPALSSDLTLCNARGVELIGSSYLGLDNITLAWTYLSGPTVPVFETADEAQTLVTNIISGTYVFNYSVSSSTCSSNDNITVEIKRPEVANAGSDLELCGENTINLSGNASTTATSTWYLLEGADTGTFSAVNGANTSYGPVQEGEDYVFAYSLDNGACITYDYVDVNYKQEVVLDLNVDGCGSTAATITPNVSPPGNYTYLWSNGETTQSITVSTENVTEYQLTVSAEGYCTTTEEVTIEACLPITLSYFKGEVENCRISIFWETLEEINVASFEVEKSYDGVNYRTIGSLEAIGGEHAQLYEIWDEEAQNTNYYRLKIIDIDQTFEYHDLQVQVTTDCYKNQFNGITDLYPNPTSGKQIQLKYFTQLEEEVSIQLFDISGRKIRSKSHQSIAGGDVLSIQIEDLPAGAYYVKLVGEDWGTRLRKFVKVN